MGLNDNSGEVFVEATLTDLGRERLARNDGSFSIVKFRLGDDEIDYRRWNELTGSTAKDAAILDTPLFEAFGNEAISLRYPLVSIANPYLKYVPELISKPSAVSLRENNDSLGGGQDVVVYQEFTRAQQVIPSELVDVNYSIEVDNDLLFVSGELPVSKSRHGHAYYVVPASPGVTAAGGTQLNFTLRVQTLSPQVFDILAGASVAKPRNITTNVIVTGQQSGLNVSIPITITEYATS
jgi:hypothetical protein